MPQKVDFRTLVGSLNYDSEYFSKGFTPDTQRFAVETGFHVYGELHLTLKLTAASDTEDAAKLLRILQEYTSIAEACAPLAGAELLEVQGERIHLLIPAAAVTRESVNALLRFSVAFTNTVYTRIHRLAGDDFRGFKMAADHGKAVLVASGSQANASVVSLGSCANAPAKQLRATDAGTIRLRTEHYKAFEQTGEWREWTNVPVKAAKGVTVPVVADDLVQNFSAASETELKDKFLDPVAVKFATREYLQEALKRDLAEPLKMQGFGFRADLDGFSKQVAAAKTDADILNLVARFIQIMNYPDYFGARLKHPIIKLPWAGDCANLIVLPNGHNYEDSREFLPVRAASEWHTQMSGHDDSRVAWTKHINGAQWSVGVAGGDDEQCSNGFVLVASLKGRRRNFLVAAGWGVGRSLDAQEADGVQGGDTVVHDVDHQALASSHKAAFDRLKGSSLFWVSHGLTNDKVRSSGAASLATNATIQVSGVTQSIPAPRPWSYYV
jgi:hypothetical protein